MVAVVAVVAIALIVGVIVMRKDAAPNMTAEQPTTNEIPNTATAPTPAVETPTPSEGSTTPTPTAPEPTPSAPVKSFTVSGKNFTFAPAEMRVKKGDRVKITFVNESGFHDLVIDEFNARTAQIGAGKTETIEFVADKTGSFEYYCSVGSHRQMGMKGTLIVE